MRNMYRMLMIGFGAGLITLGFVGIVLSGRVEAQKRQDWVLMCQRAGASVASFNLSLSTGEYNLRTWLWVHNHTDSFYAISDIEGDQIVALSLATTEQSSEWKLSDTYFQVIDPGYYKFELFNATISNVHSTTKLYYNTYVDEYEYLYRGLFWIGVFSLVIGAPLVFVGFVNPLTPSSKN